MKIHEYQAMALFAEYGVPVPDGKPAFSAEEAYAAAVALGEGPYVVKAQIHSGGRGKAGGVKFANGPDEVRACAAQLLGKRLYTKQTGAQGRIVQRLLVSRKINIDREFYLSFTVDGAAERTVMIASASGGMEIEEIAAKEPDKILKTAVDPELGLMDYQAWNVGEAIGLHGEQLKGFIRLCKNLYRLFTEKNCSLAEINPLALTADGKLIAADAKLNFDDNALSRHPENAALRDFNEEDPRETEASKYDLNYIQLDGSIGCMVNGAGLAMATMDIIQAFGGNPANFLDVGGSATEEKVAGAFSILLSDPAAKGIFINIFGGIMKCDVIASGVVSAARRLSVHVPVVVRLTGTHAEEGRRILSESGLKIYPALDMADGAAQICQLVKEASA